MMNDKFQRCTGFGRLLCGLAALLCASSATAASCPAPFRVMSFNIRLDTTADGTNAWPYRRDFLSGQIAVLQPDILGLQEVVANQKRDLEAALPHYAFLGVARDDGKEAGEFSNLVISRAHFQVRSSGTFWLSETPGQPSLGWDASYRRVVTWAHLRRRSDGQAILALNSHWDNNGKLARLKSGELIRQWIATNRHKGEAVVVMGDFNAEPGTPELATLIANSTGNEPLIDSASAPSIGSRTTFNAFTPIPQDKRVIDYIFTNPSLAPRRHAVVSWIADSKVASDHFAVLADVQPISARCR